MIEVDTTELRNWQLALDMVPDKLHREMTITTNIVLVEMSTKAKELAPVKDGPLRADIRVMQVGGGSPGGAYTGRVGTDLIYSAQREYGGTILPRNGKYLVFQIDGEWIFAKSVTQTGSFYMRDTEAWMQSQVVDYYDLAVMRALGGAF